MKNTINDLDTYKKRLNAYIHTIGKSAPSSATSDQ